MDCFRLDHNRYKCQTYVECSYAHTFLLFIIGVTMLQRYRTVLARCIASKWLAYLLESYIFFKSKSFKTVDC